MFVHIFYVLVRAVAIPVVFIYVLSNTFLGYQNGFLAVNIVLTIVMVPLMLWQGIKILPNLALIRTREVLKLAVEIVVEFLALVIFWLVYLSVFA